MSLYNFKKIAVVPTAKVNIEKVLDYINVYMRFSNLKLLYFSGFHRHYFV